MFKSSMPLNVQFEVSYRCNNNCIFCYNVKQKERYRELTTAEAKVIIKNLKDSGVITLNFNGGEPLLREDFFELAKYAYEIGLDIHLNTNSSLIDDCCARKLAAFFSSICTTVLSGNPFVHDMLSGRKGAFRDVVNGIKALQRSSVYVAVNVVLCGRNCFEIEETLYLLKKLDVRTLLITRYVPDSGYAKDLTISDKDYFAAIETISKFHTRERCFDRVAMPQPVQICTVPNNLKNVVREWNIPCSMGLCTGSVNAFGQFTPCNLVKKPVIGNVLNTSLCTLWNCFDGIKFIASNHLRKECATCSDIKFCGGGCLGYNMSVGKE